MSGYDILYGKVKDFISNYLFTVSTDIDNLNTLRNLSEIQASKTIIESFKKSINELTVQDKGDAEIRDYINLRKTRRFCCKDQGFLIPRKSIFNKIIGDSRLELDFAAFLENCEDISYAKNFLAVHFTIDYINKDGFPSIIIRILSLRLLLKVVLVETKGLEDLDVPLKMKRLKQWCEDINKIQKEVN